MSIRQSGAVIHLEGVLGVEEAEVLAAHLAGGVRTVDVSACDGAHSAIIQVLLSFAPELEGEARGDGLREIVLPALEAAMRGQGHGKSLSLNNNGGPATTPSRPAGASE